MKHVLFTGAFLSLAVIGCRHGNGPSYTNATLKPAALNQRTADLVLPGGTNPKFPVDLETKLDGENFTIRLLTEADREEIETESYRTSDSEFDLVGASSDVFDPPIPLLKFPLATGDSWSWSGENKSGDISRKATAEVKTSENRLKIGGIWTTTVRSMVTLSIESEGSKPAVRTLTFDFQPGEGLIRREFGEGSSRVPENEEDEPAPKAPKPTAFRGTRADGLRPVRTYIGGREITEKMWPRRVGAKQG